MQCANPQCSKELLYLRKGRLDLLELDSHAHDRAPGDDGGFPINTFPSKFFWLCGECAKTHFIKRWTASGVVLESHRSEGRALPDLSCRSVDDRPQRLNLQMLPIFMLPPFNPETS
jgi:hypothetical protein